MSRIAFSDYDDRSRSLSKVARASILKMTARAGASHVGSSLSIADILSVLYTFNPQLTPRLWMEGKGDTVIVSKGHAAAALYATLAHCDYFALDELEKFCADGSDYFGHVTSGRITGVDFSTGSLGHGLGFGCGQAITYRRLNKMNHVFVVMSDGECNEGSTWEAALFASHHELSNLTVIVDRNRLQSFGSTEETLALEPFAEKWVSFGWQMREIDGHDHRQIHLALSEPRSNRPLLILANTIKGKGVSFMENEVQWHYSSPTPAQLNSALSEIENTA